MSIVSALIPAEAVLANAMNVARPLIGLGVLAAVLVFFKPLLVGMLRAMLLMIKPAESREQRSAREIFEGVLMVNRMARDVEAAHPALAAELRAIGARG
jgi:hypothetical protein